MFPRNMIFWHQIYEICDSTGYTYDIKLYLGRDRQCTAQHLTVARAAVTELTRKIEGHAHKFYMDNFLSSPELFNYMTKKKLNCCGTLRLNRKGMLKDLRCKTVKLRRGGGGH
jgi:hypothetical protein